MMGVIIPMDRIRDRAERPENNPVPYPDTSGRSRYAVIVCKCEKVSEAEIVDAIHRNAGARSVKGVKKRVGAGFGRCQAGFCQPVVVSILARELGIPKDQVLYDGPGSEILKGKVK